METDDWSRSKALGLDEEAIFRSLHAAYPDALLVVDASGAIVLSNQAAETLLGYSAFELVGMNVDQLVPDAIRARHADYRRQYGQNPRSRAMGSQTDLVARRKNGDDVMVEIALSPLQGHGLPLVVAAIRDVGAYPRVKQALLRARYAELLALVGRDAVDARDPQVLLGRAPSIAVQALDAAAVAVWLLNADHASLRLVGSAGDAATALQSQIELSLSETHVGYVLGHAAATRSVICTENRFGFPDAYSAADLQSGLGVPIFDR